MTENDWKDDLYDSMLNNSAFGRGMVYCSKCGGFVLPEPVTKKEARHFGVRTDATNSGEVMTVRCSECQSERVAKNPQEMLTMDILNRMKGE